VSARFLIIGKCEYRGHNLHLYAVDDEYPSRGGTKTPRKYYAMIDGDEIPGFWRCDPSCENAWVTFKNQAIKILDQVAVGQSWKSSKDGWECLDWEQSKP